ncbi:MAG TPA: winged helix-turn-helix domain-containing protein [Candidatus Thermoplasmatota archaeon]|nr:winged helix-turn-helix domain-containing protein [Candidatus Thermoplasmatota archaeon]
MGRRDRSAILGEVMQALSEAGGAGDTRLTAVATRTNLPYDRLQEYVRDLQARGLVDPQNPFRLTPEGRELLAAFRSWRERLGMFGLLP